jgi:Enhanced disease susceptibility 1 protein EP domain
VESCHGHSDTDCSCALYAQGELPPAFGVARLNHIRFSNSRWLESANNFRQLVEPFDIANYYRMGLDRGSGHYLSGRNRPDIYTQLQDVWLPHLKGCNPRPMTFTSLLVWARAMEGVRDAPEAPAAAGTPVQPLPPAVLPPGTLPLGHEEL